MKLMNPLNSGSSTSRLRPRSFESDLPSVTTMRGSRESVHSVLSSWTYPPVTRSSKSRTTMSSALATETVARSTRRGSPLPPSAAPDDRQEAEGRDELAEKLAGARALVSRSKEGGLVEHQVRDADPGERSHQLPDYVSRHVGPR